MKKGNLIFLVLAIIMFIFIMIPYFQNTMINPPVVFYFGSKPLLKIYLWLITFAIVEGVFITLYVQSLMRDMRSQDIEKFDLE